MKIVYINTVCSTGSTGKITTSLYHLSKSAGHEPYIAYGRGTAASELNSYKIGNLLDFGAHVLSNFFRGNSGFASLKVTKKFILWLEEIQPDLIHLHNIHGFYINIPLLFDYIKRKQIPVVWTLHDCWPITGQCAFFEYSGCEKWKKECYSCPVYRSDYPYSLFKDNSKKNYYIKKETFTNIPKMIIVTPSHWMAFLIKESFLKEYPVITIPNGIDLNIFSPNTNNVSSKVPLSQNPLDNNKRILLGVANVWDKRKGLEYFKELADTLDSNYHIVLIGVSKKQQKKLGKQYPNRITAITRTTNQKELAEWYRNAYAFINPTLEDNFPTTNLEALACGTPVITFNTGGSPEALTSSCGIVVEKGNIKKLKEAILSLENSTEITSSTCRIRSLIYDKDRVFEPYLELYNRIL
ncbi:MAG: glycosyltransferase [Lachnospiraceae bacterium]|nr:glycosyltransferase [Lachnospiraceae bacterium]